MGGMAKHVIGIRDDGREFRDKLNALPHQIIAGSVICIRVKTIHLEHAARQDVHNVVSFKFNDIHLGLLLQRHVVVDEFTERREFFLVGQATGKQQVGNFLKTEPFLFDDGVCQVIHIITAVEQFAGNRLQPSTGDAFIADHIAYFGQPHQDSRAVLITQTALHIKLPEQFILNPGSFLQIFGKLVNQILLLHNRFVLFVIPIFYFSYNLPGESRSGQRNATRHKTG